MDPDTNPKDEIYVDTRDEVVATEMLRCVAPTLTMSFAEADARLGLTRWRVAGDVGAALAGARAAIADSSAPRCEFDDGRQVQLRSLDDLVGALRSHAARHYNGWCPVIDSNHDVLNVNGTDPVGTEPHVKIAADDPTEVSAPHPPVRGAWPDGPRVAVADARVFAHKDLAGHIVGEPLTDAKAFASTGPGHATFVAGTVLRRAPSAVLVARTVLVPGGPNWSWDVAGRLMQLLDEDIDIVNMSFGCLTDSAPPLPLRRAMELLGGRAVLVAAAGNHGDVRDGHVDPLYPAAFGNVVAAGAAQPDGRPASTTPYVPWLDLLAPGEDLIGPFLHGDVTLSPGVAPTTYETGYVTWSGSSFAAAAVTGEIARRMVSNRVDAFTARDQLLAAADGDIVAFQYRRDGLGPGEQPVTA